MATTKSGKRTVRSSAKATRDLVQKLGGRMVPLSGSGLEKGDGRVPGRFRIETKRPPTEKYRLTCADWAKIRDAALRSNEVPVFHMKLGPHDIIVLREEDYFGLGGTVHGPQLVGNLGVQAGHTFSAQSWGEWRTRWKHLRCIVEMEQASGLTSYTLRAMPESDFLALAERGSDFLAVEGRK
jgi:hypothetical protein